MSTLLDSLRRNFLVQGLIYHKILKLRSLKFFPLILGPVEIRLSIKSPQLFPRLWVKLYFHSMAIDICTVYKHSLLHLALFVPLVQGVSTIQLVLELMLLQRRLSDC